MNPKIVYSTLGIICVITTMSGAFTEDTLLLSAGYSGLALLILLALGAVLDQTIRAKILLANQVNLLVSYFRNQGIDVSYGERTQESSREDRTRTGS